MIRPIMQNDSSTVIALAVAAGLFPVDDTDVLHNMMARYFSDSRDDGHRCVIDEDDDPCAVAYYEPALVADRTWYLTMIAVHPASQGHGRGIALMRYIENDLQTDGQRLLLIQTSGLLAFDRTRMFYKKCGYVEEARIRDYWETGDDMVLFRKVLNTV